MEKRLTMFFACLFLSFGLAMAQTKVNGTVVSQEDNEPVIGASVLVVGTNVGAVTDANGHFELTLPAGKKTLRITYVGMEPIEVSARANMRIILTNDQTALDEIIVTGYGNYKKSTFTGAATTMDATKYEDVPAVSFEDKLAGLIPGLMVTNNSSSPGAVNNIRIRGMGSINAGNNPLYVIDGTPVTSGNLSEFDYSDAGSNIMAALNSNDIESITVIKDAAAASLYGSRAANGVIVITTKNGKVGKTHVDFRSDWGVSNVAVNYRPQLSGQDRRALLHQGLVNYGMYQGDMSSADATTFADNMIDRFAAEPEGGYTDWKDLMFKNGHHQNYQLSVSGGNEATQFYTSLAYTKQTGILENQGLERFTGNANLTHKFGRFTINVTSLLSKMRQNVVNEATSYDGAIANYAFFQSPSSTPYNEDGSLNDGCGMFGVNPLFEFKHSSDLNTVVRTFNTAKLSYEIIDGLTLSEKIAYDYISGEEDVLWDRESNNGAPGGVFQRILNKNERLTTQTQLNYVQSFGLHNINALLGFETEDNKYEYNYIAGQDYPGPLYEFANAGDTSAESNKFGSRLTSFLGRVDYNYNNVYYLGASYRRDGSSRLGRDNRWGDFWSVSGSWRFSAEKFMNPIKNIVTDGKIRISYGVNGTQPSGYYGYMNQYKFGQYYNGSSGMAIIGIGNPDIRWEKNKAFNFGIDLSFLHRWSINLDIYSRITSDLIYDLPVSAVPGYYSSSYTTTTPQNIGSLKNTGYELTLTSVNIDKKDFNWTTSLNFGHNSNKVRTLDGEQDQVISGVLIHKVGEPYYSYWAYEYAGVDPQTGEELYYINDDTDNARNTTTNQAEANKVIIGNHQPTIEGGLSNTIRWKSIDFGLTLTFSLGGDAFDYATWQHSNGSAYLYNGAVPSYYNLNDMWTGPGDTSASQPKFEYGSAGVLSSRWLMPTDYLRVKNLTLGFTVPQQYTRKAGISKARVFFAAANLLTWKSKDLFVDPEMPVDGLCTFETPALRTYTFGVEIGF